MGNPRRHRAPAHANGSRMLLDRGLEAPARIHPRMGGAACKPRADAACLDRWFSAMGSDRRSRYRLGFGSFPLDAGTGDGPDADDL
jgi:hypothetical protein